jgi:hypothetical protein
MGLENAAVNLRWPGYVRQIMRLTDDLSSGRAIFWKGWLFLVLGAMAGGLILLEAGSWRVAALLAICVWAFCRWYYFAFYVIERYVDPSFKFAGLGSFLKYMARSTSRTRTPIDNRKHANRRGEF